MFLFSGMGLSKAPGRFGLLAVAGACLLSCISVTPTFGAGKAAAPEFFSPQLPPGRSLTNDLRDCWSAIGTATNAWAMAIRRTNDFQHINSLSMDACKAEARASNTLAELRL
ncbi:hypothetical protein, partial [Micromonospora sp. AMSO31t]|uniref:hypothetical protein n=1 Tax=Micromonospora sp. AMSO31t TaxID=2650566 RepID=UPI001CEC03A1